LFYPLNDVCLTVKPKPVECGVAMNYAGGGVPAW